MNAGYAMGGQMEQNAPVQHHVHHSNHAAAAGTDTGDAVMARWLQSAGLQHLAAPLAAAALDHRLLPSLLMQVPSPPSPFFFDWDSGMPAFILCHSHCLLLYSLGSIIPCVFVQHRYGSLFP
jgi:hypothetical protein